MTIVLLAEMELDSVPSAIETLQSIRKATVKYLVLMGNTNCKMLVTIVMLIVPAVPTFLVLAHSAVVDTSWVIMTSVLSKVALMVSTIGMAPATTVRLIVKFVLIPRLRVKDVKVVSLLLIMEWHVSLKEAALPGSTTGTETVTIVAPVVQHVKTKLPLAKHAKPDWCQTQATL